MDAISAENLSPITHHQIPVIATELLARLYGTEPVRIRQSHQRNADRFICGKHYFKLEGKELADLRVSLSYSQNPVPPKARSLILWTERGAARHAKMLETDQAWDVFEKLEDCYFSQKVPELPQSGVNADIFLSIRNGQINFLQQAKEGEFFASVDTFIELSKKRGYIVIHPDELIKRLIS